MSSLPAALRRAYARTAYGAEGATARIGRRDAGIDALLARMGVRQGAFLTAWNPWSRRMPRGWNERMLARLQQAARRWPAAEGWGRGEGRGLPWAERHLLVGADPRPLARLARRFRQHAIVVVRAGAPARLCVLSGRRGA